MNKIQLMWDQHHYLVKKRAKKYTWSIIRTVLLVGLCFLILRPFLEEILFTFMKEKDLYDNSVVYVPKNFTLENIGVAASVLNYKISLINTTIFSVVVSVIQVLSCTLVAYGFARFEFPAKKVIFGLVILTLVIPPQTLVSAQYLNFRFYDVFGIFELLTGKPLNLIGSYWPSILLGAGAVGLKNGLYIYMIRQYFRGLPKELEEAAYVDGSNAIRTFFQIMLPSAIPILVSCFLFSFVWQWNDVYHSSLFTQGIDLLPKMAIGARDAIKDLMPDNSLTTEYQMLIEGTMNIMAKLPIIIIYIVAQRSFVESMQRSGMKG